jgi:NADPH-dependent 2,4-dienoyl-CoA reductase/sulfur reductase-like enzyme
VHYSIVGNGVAGITAALKLRERDNQAAITVISDESDYFFSRTALMYAYMDRMSLRDLEPFERKVYEKNFTALPYTRVSVRRRVGLESQGGTIRADPAGV